MADVSGRGTDAKNELIWVERAPTDGGARNFRVDYKYDALGNRIQKAIDNNGDGVVDITQRYAYDGWKTGPQRSFVGNENWDVWVDLDGTNALTTRYVRGDVVDQVFARVDSGTPYWQLTDRLGSEAFAIQALAGRVDRDTGWTYMGIDLSPAPLKNVSIAAALETLTGQPIGSPGTLTGAATIAAAIRDIQVKQTGYSGLMLPVLEDSRLAQRWSEGRISLDALLSYSAVCGTGLDTVPLPGDITEQQLELVIGDMASLAVKWHKPLSARLLPVAGKNAGDTTEFDDPYLVNATLRPLGGKSQ